MADRSLATVKPSPILDAWKEDPEMAFFRDTYYGDNINDHQFKILAMHAGHLGLDVIKNEMQAISIEGKMIPYVTIHGWRTLAELSGRYDGGVGPEFQGEDKTVWLPYWDSDKPPVAARFTVYKKGERVPTVAYVTYKDSVKMYKDKTTGKRVETKTWREMPSYMLGIRAETNALKKAKLVPMTLPSSFDEEDPDEDRAKWGASRRLHAVGRENGLDHDGVRAVVKELNPGIESLRDVRLGSTELIEAAGVIDAGLVVTGDVNGAPNVSPAEYLDGVATSYGWTTDAAELLGISMYRETSDKRFMTAISDLTEAQLLDLANEIIRIDRIVEPLTGEITPTPEVEMANLVGAAVTKGELDALNAKIKETGISPEWLIVMWKRAMITAKSDAVATGPVQQGELVSAPTNRHTN